MAEEYLVFDDNDSYTFPAASHQEASVKYIECIYRNEEHRLSGQTVTVEGQGDTHCFRVYSDFVQGELLTNSEEIK